MQRESKTTERQQPKMLGELLSSAMQLSTGNSPSSKPSQLQTLNAACQALRNQYPSMRDFAALYTPQNCLKWAINSRRRCLLGTAPTVGQLATTYGTEPVVAWMASHLTAVNTMFNLPADRQLNMTQCMLVASSWINTHPVLKASELWVFLGDWLGGRWGKKSYGAIDPTEMGANLGEFIRNRQKVESDKEQMAEAQRKAREEQHFRAMLTYAQTMSYCANYDALTEQERHKILYFVYQFGLETPFMAQSFLNEYKLYVQERNAQEKPFKAQTKHINQKSSE